MTDIVCAHQLENNDILEDGRYVYSKEDAGDFINVNLCDDEGECEIVPFAPFDVVSIVV